MRCAGLWPKVAVAGAIALGAACQGKPPLQQSVGVLVFDAPSGGPVSVGQPDSTHLEFDFGQVVSGTSSQVVLKVTNTGGAAVRVLGISPSEPDPAFSIGLSAGSVVVPGGAPLEVPMTFHPPALGDFATSFSIATDAPAQAAISVAMRGQGAPQAIAIAPAPLAFGNVLQGTDAQAWMSVTNVSTAEHGLKALPFTGPNASLLTILDPLPDRLGPLETFNFRVDFHAPQDLLGPAGGSLTLSMDCRGCSQTVALTAEAVASCLVVTPSTLEFGVAPSGTSQELSVQIRNIANRVVTFTGTPSIDQGKRIAFFLGAGAPVKFETLAPGEETRVSVILAPGGPGDFAGLLAIATTDPVFTEITIPLHGVGLERILSCSPTQLDFGEVAFGAPFTHQVTCTNIAPADTNEALPIVGTVTGAGFSLVQSGGPEGTGIYPGQSAQYLVTLDPAAATASGTLTVAPRSPFATPVSLPLLGRGVSLPSCTLGIWPDGGLGFGAIAGGSQFTIPMVLRNLGPSDCLASIGTTGYLPGEFSLPTASTNSIRLGAEGSQGGPPSEVEIPVQFAPNSAFPPRSEFDSAIYEGTIQLQFSNPTQGSFNFDTTGFQSWPGVLSSTAVDFGRVPVGQPPGSCSGSTLMVILPGPILDSDSDAFSIGNGGTTPPLSPLVFRPTQLGRQHLIVKDLSHSSSVPAPVSVLLAIGEGVAGPCAIPDAGP